MASSDTQLPENPSFKGRLQLAEFMHKPDLSSPMARRSPRLSTPLLGPSSTAGSSAPASASASVLSRTASASPARNLSRRGAKSTTSPLKRKRSQKSGSSGYAPPSTYAHLPELPDAIAPNLLVLFIGLNPGIETARTGHAYAHPSNLFWKLLASSGVTPVPCRADEDREMPARFSLGLTNIVSRPSRNGAELSKAEMDAGVAVLEAKAREFRPESMCVVGKSIWESIWRVRHGRGITKSEFRYGWQDASENMGRISARDADRPAWEGARVFVATSTSGLAASLKPAEKEAIWRELGVWVERRRAERKAVEDQEAAQTEA